MICIIYENVTATSILIAIHCSFVLLQIYYNKLYPTSAYHTVFSQHVQITLCLF